MLFPTTIITDLAENSLYAIPNGALSVFPFEITARHINSIFLMHTDMTQQDRSLRAWVSTDIADTEMAFYPLDTASWHPGRSPHHIVSVYDKVLEAPAGNFLLPVPIGQYYLQVLNLTNRQNAFMLQFAVTSGDDDE